MLRKAILQVLAILLTTCAIAQSADVTPDKLGFRRQAVRRMIFDRSQHIPLASLEPTRIVGIDVMHPSGVSQDIDGSVAEATARIKDGRLLLAAADKPASAARWIGGFNPFATYELALHETTGDSHLGIRFADTGSDSHLTANVVVSDGRYTGLEWIVIKDGQQVEKLQYPWPEGVPSAGPTTLRVQMLAVGVNLYIEANGTSHLVGYPDFNQHIELRHKELINRYEFHLIGDFASNSSAAIDRVTSALSPGCGQADIRAITTRDGRPLIDEGRVWLTMTVRGRALPHPMQGVFSINPSVFDIRFEGIIVFDMGDGLWRNELASHLFYDEPSGQWRGWTTGFSALGTKSKKEEKAILAVSSDRDPRRGFSVMRAKPIGLDGQHEDPHGVYDAEANRWRLLLSERAGKYRAGMWESVSWDQGYTRLAGPVEMDSTGTLIQSVGDKRYAFFGSADRKIYIRSYPTLDPVGELDVHRPPWTDETGTRIWPNIIPLPEGYPAPYIAVMMDRVNYPDMPSRNWTYGAMYLFHAHP